MLPTKSGVHEIVIRTSTPEAELPPGRRVAPADASKMAKLVAASGGHVLRTTEGAGHYRLVGLEIAPAPSVDLFDIVLLGSWTSDGTWTETSVDQLPHDIAFDRVFIHGDPVKRSRRGIAMNGVRIGLYNSYISDFKQTCCDSQALAAWNGAGPFTVVNNYLEAAGREHHVRRRGSVLPRIDSVGQSHPQDHLSKPFRWKPDDPAYEGTNWVVKNLLELKNAKDVMIDGNTLENNWADDQNGFAILFTPRNQDGNSPWATVENVRFTNNEVRHATSAINILRWDNQHPGGQARNIVIRNNVFWDIGGAAWGPQSPFARFT